MPTTSYAERARQFRASTAIHAKSGNERNERNEINTHNDPGVASPESPRPCEADSEKGYPPLDAVIAADVARQTPRDVIAARVERLATRAALPDATALDIAVAADWREILQAKQGDPR